jgi:hypothetical protein
VFYGYILDFTDISFLYGSFLCVVFALLTATGDAIPLPVRWPYLLYCLDDRALRRHIILSLYSILQLNTHLKTFTVSYFSSYCLYKRSKDKG